MKIEIKNEKERIDKFLANELNISRTEVQKKIKNGEVKVNEKLVKNNFMLEPGMIIDIIESDTKMQAEQIKAEKMNLEIIYEDEYLAIINKPSNLVVHPAPGHYTKTLVNGLMYHFNKLSSINGELRPGIVHRIDKDTSGLLIVTKDNKTHELIAKMLEKKEVQREYVAIVHGEIEEEEAEIIAPIGRDAKDRKKMAVTSKNSKYAKTNFEVLKRYKNYSLIKCILETGRTHQIRVHLNYINYPIVGDPVYGPKNTIDTIGQALHAYRLHFIHPITGENIDVIADIPEEFKKTIKIIKG